MHTDAEDPAFHIGHDGGRVARLDGGDVFRSVPDRLVLNGCHLHRHRWRTLLRARIAAAAAGQAERYYQPTRNRQRKLQRIGTRVSSRPVMIHKISASAGKASRCNSM